jgi:hypothetical protein
LREIDLVDALEVRDFEPLDPCLREAEAARAAAQAEAEADRIAREQAWPKLPGKRTQPNKPSARRMLR